MKKKHLIKGSQISPQTTYVNQNYFYRIPHNAFNVSESISNSLTYSASNLPTGFEVEGRTISGVPTSGRLVSISFDLKK